MEKPTTDDELPKYIGPLTENEIASRIEMPPSQQTVDLGLFQLRYAYLSQRGYYPECEYRPGRRLRGVNDAQNMWRVSARYQSRSAC